ncbi:MAG: hypothetical protein JWM93_3279 [Frankiales bacterium]|nr:hypothetical protein [Frankiales bacterium]
MPDDRCPVFEQMTSRVVTAPGLVLVGLAIAIGIVGILVPILPGILLVIGAVLVWAAVEGGATAWVVFGVAAALTVASQVAKYVIPGRRLRESGVPTRTLLIAGAVGVVGFFVIPVVGLVVGFIVAVYALERQRLGTDNAARASTIAALKAAGLSMVIELVAGLVIAVVWIVGVVVT